MADPIEIQLEVVEPILLEIDSEPIYYIGSKQVGPSGKQMELRSFGTILQWKYITDAVWYDLFDLQNQSPNVTFEALLNNGDIGAGADQVAIGNHDHEIGDMSLIFDNQLI